MQRKLLGFLLGNHVLCCSLVENVFEFCQIQIGILLQGATQKKSECYAE